MTPRNSGAWIVSASRNQSQSPARLLHGPVQDVGLARPAGGKMVVGQGADARVAARELAGDRPGPVGAAIVDDEDLELGDNAGRTPRPGNRPGRPPRPWPG